MSTARFGFIVAMLTYLVFLGLEFIRPGFVTYVFSPHLALLPMAVFGFSTAREHAVQPKLTSLWLTIPIGLAIGVIFWFAGDAFGDFRLLLALGAAALPSLAYFAVRDRT